MTVWTEAYTCGLKAQVGWLSLRVGSCLHLSNESDELSHRAYIARYAYPYTYVRLRK